jgi:hypothetical protein
MKRILFSIILLYTRYPFLRAFQWLIIIAIPSLIFFYVFRPSSVETYPVGWERSFYISPPFIEAKNPHISRRGNIIAVVYQGSEVEKKERVHHIYTSLSLNGGRSYLAPIKIAPVSGTLDHNPIAAISSLGHIAVAWQNIVPPKSNSRLFYSFSQDMGASWSQPTELGIIRDSATESDMDMLPVLEFDDRNRLHIFYHALRGDVFNLFYSSSDDAKTFTVPRKLVDVSEGLRGAFFPAVRFRGGEIYIVWQGRKLAAKQFIDDLYFLKSTNYGSSFSRSRAITYGLGSSASPSIEVRGNSVYVAYQNNRDKTWGIWLSASRNGGESWDAPMKISDTNANCYAPSVVQSSADELLFIWYDLRGRQPALFSRKLSLEDGKMQASTMISKQDIPAVAPMAVNVDKKVVVAWREGSRIMTNFTDIYVAPPLVTSPTHPEDRWSRAPSALIDIRPPEDEAGIKFYSVVVNQDPNYNPPDVESISGRITRYQTALLDDGVHYVHIRAVDNAGNVSKTVHYKLQISRSPAQVSELKSPTHKEGVPDNAKTAEFKWDVNPPDLPRVKGFLIGISKDTITEPKQFTTDFSIKYENLEEGRYFFALRTVDKTNTPGTMFSYEIIIGSAAELDVEKIKQLAKDIESKETESAASRNIRPRIIGPIIDVHFPFDPSKPSTSRSFDIYVSPRNISEKNIEGYSILIDTKKPALEETVNVKGNVFRVTGLKNGTYYLAYRAKYHTGEGRNKRSFWTDPVIKKFHVEVPIGSSPVMAYSERVIEKISSRWLALSISLMGLVIGLVTIGFGNRIAFSIHALWYRFRR